MAFASIYLAFAAGLLSILSPCVLPLVPVVVGAAVAEQRLAPLALATGLALSFTAIGTFVATIGYALGLDGEWLRSIAATMLVVVGIVLAIPGWQSRFALAAGPLGDWAGQRFGGRPGHGLWGQFGVGALLGAVWSPCVGPVLGAASVLAAKGKDLGHVALTMFSFGIGSAIPLLLIGLLSRETLLRWRSRMLAAGRSGKMLLGGVLLAGGLMILLGLDKAIEARLVQILPQWLADLAGRL
jgi:cytochrome c-type biogenesis protein